MRARGLLAVVLIAASIDLAGAQVVRQLTDTKTSVPGPPAMDDAGTVVYGGTSSNALGSNPNHAFQIVRWNAVSGAGTAITSNPAGVTPLVSVSDDGQWLAFPSSLDLVGTNHDRSTELFVMKPDGSGVAQLTNDPAPNAGSVSSVVMAGGGTKIGFVSNSDPLGTNAAHKNQLFVIGRDGSGLRQLTNTTTGSISALTLSDDGTRAVFVSSENLAGGNADLGDEVFAINTDGTGLRQLTNAPATYDATSAWLSGNGTKVAFQSNADLVAGNNTAHYDEIFVIGYDGTALKQVTKTSNLLSTPASQSPSITDDGLTIVYASNQSSLFVNFDGNTEIFRIKSDGTGIKALTSTLLLPGGLMPVVSGNGTRVAFYTLASFGSNPETAPQLAVMDINGAGTKQLTDTHIEFLQEPDLSADGSQLVFTRNDRTLGNAQLWRIASDGSQLAPVLTLSSGQAHAPRIAADKTTVVFNSDSNQTGGNGDTSQEIFRVNLDGTGLTQLTNGASGTTCQNAAVARVAQTVVFECDADLTGGNADASREIFKIDITGSGLVQLTSGPSGKASQRARIDDSGTWVVFESNADFDGGNADGSYEVWRVRTDGTGLQRLTSGNLLDSRGPDISGDGDRIVFSSSANPLGTNPEGNAEIFAYTASTATTTQLTSFATGSSSGARIGGDGRWVWFTSSAPVFESLPGSPSELYRVPFAGGAVQRTDALRTGGLGGIGGVAAALSGGGSAVALDASGELAALSSIGNPTGGNPDYLPEIWLISRTALPAISVTRPAPTVVRWDVESGPVRYDVLRGDVSQLRPPGDLGTVSCLENDSPDNSTDGNGDPLTPAPGKAFFYVYRGAQGLSSPGSYGTSTTGAERVPSAGDCAH